MVLGKRDFPDHLFVADGFDGFLFQGDVTNRILPAVSTLNGDGVADLVLSEASNIGHPGAVYLVFGPSPYSIRGDANRDGQVELTDAVAVLSLLFLGNPTILCEDGADADDDGALTVTDPIYLLTHLFLGGPAPPPPYPKPGRDGTADRLRCRPS